MEASGSTLPSARVFRKFDKSHPTPHDPSHPFLPLFYLSTSPHTSIARASDEISSSSQSLVIPEAFWAGGPDIPRAFPKASIATPALLIWPRSTFCPLCLVCSSLRSLPTTYFASSKFCELIIKHDFDLHKKANQKRESKRARELIGVRIEIDNKMASYNEEGRIMTRFTE